MSKKIDELTATLLDAHDRLTAARERHLQARSEENSANCEVSNATIAMKRARKALDDELDNLTGNSR